MKKSKKVSLIDLSMLLIVIVTLAFHDNPILLASTQLIGCIIIYFFRITKEKISYSKILYIIWLGMFVAWGSLSIFWASHSLNVLITIRSVLQVAMTGFAIVLYVNDVSKIEKIINYISYGSIILIMRLLLAVPLYAWGSERVGNYIGYGNNSAALVLSYASIFIFYSFLKNKKKRNLFLTIIFILFSFLCGSKKAFIICVLGIGTQLILNAKNPLQIVRKILFTISITLLLVYLVIKVDFLYNVLGIRIEEMLLALSGKKGGDMSTMDRILFARNSFEVFLKHPFIGVGLDNYRFNNYMIYYAHNNYLEIAADLGIIGIVLYYWFPVKVFIGSINKKNIIIIILIFIILIMDIANVSYETDSIQLYIATIYSMFLQFNKTTIKETNCEKKTIKSI